MKVKQLTSWNYCLEFIADQAALLGRGNPAGQESKRGVRGRPRKAGGAVLETWPQGRNGGHRPGLTRERCPEETPSETHHLESKS